MTTRKRGGAGAAKKGSATPPSQESKAAEVPETEAKDVEAQEAAIEEAAVEEAAVEAVEAAVEEGEAGRRDGDDEFAPTAAELAEAAALRESLESGEAADAIAAARTAEPAPPRPSPKTGTWFGCALDRDGEAMVTEQAYGDPEKSREAAILTLPNDPDPQTLLAVQANSRDEALERFESKREAFEAGGAIPADRTAPARVSLIESRTEAIEGTELLISATGMIHVNPECRFVKDRAFTSVENPGGAVASVMAGESVNVQGVVAKSYCVYCAARVPQGS